MKKRIYLIPIFLGLVITSCYKDEIDAVGYLPPTSTLSLSDKGTANSYIVSQKGSYKFNTVKGNSSESVGVVASAEVLWVSFGTDVTPNVENPRK